MVLEKTSVVALPQEFQEQMISVYENLQKAKKEYEEKLHECGILMKELGLTSTKAGNYRLNLIAETISKSFDSKSFKEQYENLYASFLKESIKKEYVRMF